MEDLRPLFRLNGAFMGLPRQSAEQLFLDALELQPEKRQTFVDRACRGDPGLRRRVEELLREDDQRAEAAIA